MSTKQIPVKLTWSADEDRWIAKSTAPAAAAPGTSTEAALLALRRKVAEHLGKQSFELNSTLDLPPDLAALAATAIKSAEEFKRLSEEVPRLRAQVLHMSRGKYNLRHHEAAAILGMSPSYLSRTVSKVTDEEADELSERLVKPGGRKKS